MADSSTLLFDENINSNKEYLNWPGLKKLVDNESILPEDQWYTNKEYLNWPGLQDLWYTKIKPDASKNTLLVNSRIDDENINSNKEYLNWQGLQYLWYKKIKQVIYQNTIAVKSRIDDENWYITYDASDGKVYITLNEDNNNFYFDQDGSCGSIQDYNGMLQVVVNRDLSLMIDGFIDDSVGPIGNTSNQMGDATGKLYVNFYINDEYDSSQ